MTPENIYFKKWKSPIGDLFLYASKTHLLGLLFAGDSTDFLKHFKSAKITAKSNPILMKVILQLDEYFSGDRKKFKIPTLLLGTEFQKKVWAELKRVPFGKTITYKQQAVRINAANAVRAVGAANGKNPIAIIIPCHRVIGSSGKLVGYAGGMKVKSDLLKTEGISIQS